MSHDPTLAHWRAAGQLTSTTLALGLVFGSFGACVIDEREEDPWIGEERGALEQVPDETPSFVDEAELEDVLGEDAMNDEISDLTTEPNIQMDAWTGWYDRDNPSGDGDWELRVLQSGVCSTPTGVECRTVTGLALWQTGETVSCSANDGLLCLNANQPDWFCNYDYKVRFLCPSPPPCGNGICEAGQSYATCPQDCPPPCGDGICQAGQSYATCPQDCPPPCGDGICQAGQSYDTCPQDCPPPCGDGICQAGQDNWTCPVDCCAGLGYQGVCNNSNACCNSDYDCDWAACLPIAV